MYDYCYLHQHFGLVLRVPFHAHLLGTCRDRAVEQRRVRRAQDPHAAPGQRTPPPEPPASERRDGCRRAVEQHREQLDLRAFGARPRAAQLGAVRALDAPGGRLLLPEQLFELGLRPIGIRRGNE